MLWAYLVVFGWSFLSASMVPISSEPAFIALVIEEKKWLLPVLVATSGNLLGGLTTFYMGIKGGDLIIKKLSEKNQQKYEKIKLIVQKWGAASMVLSWIPFIGDIVVTIGGLMKLPFIPSVFWMLIGKFARYWLLAWIALGLLENF